MSNPRSSGVTGEYLALVIIEYVGLCVIFYKKQLVS